MFFYNGGVGSTDVTPKTVILWGGLEGTFDEAVYMFRGTLHVLGGIWYLVFVRHQHGQVKYGRHEHIDGYGLVLHIDSANICGEKSMRQLLSP